MPKPIAPERRVALLPRLAAGHGVQAPENAHWTSRAQALTLISRAIDVPDSAEKAHSIPDLFSQSMQFEFDLSVRSAEAVAAWQGLVAALLLTTGGGLLRARSILLAQLPNSPFAQILRDTAKRRGIERVTLFELRRTDGTYAAVAFRFDAMPSMICPAAQIRGPFEVEYPWLVNSARGWMFTTPRALAHVPEYRPAAIALRNELYALRERSIPANENRDGLQLGLLREYFQTLDALGDEISDYPVNERVRELLFTEEKSSYSTRDVDHPASIQIFTDRICLFRVGHEFNHLRTVHQQSMVVHHNGTPTPWHALLPVKRAWARQHMPELRSGAVKTRMRWRYGAIEATLLDGKDEPIGYRRYRAQDLINLSNTKTMPRVAVWPPKAMAGWNRYYLFQSGVEDMLPLGAAPLDIDPGEVSEVTLLTRMPDGLSFSLGKEEVGVLAPQFETAVNPKSREIHIGFDFGTTGTTVYKHDPSSGVTAPLSFAKDGALFIFGREADSETDMTARFVNENIADRATHYTLLRRKDEPLQEGRAIVQTAIPFLWESKFKPELIRDVSDDLKWSALGSDKLRAHLFLEQYLMMALWHSAEHGAKYVRWRASYPLSMLGRQQEDYVSKMQAIISSLCQNAYRIPYDANFCSESEAVGFMLMDNGIQARFLDGLTVNDETGFFCIDIGGGTTDMSLWLGRRLLMQASLKWAGNAILCDTVTRENHGPDRESRRNLIDSFFSFRDALAAPEHRAALTAALDEGRTGEFRRVWNVLADEIADSIKGLHRTAEPLLNYINILRFNLYLLFYFAGRMAREAANDLSKDSAAGLTNRPLPVAVLGNGAKMLMMLYNDVELVTRADEDGVERLHPTERRNESRYQEEMTRLKRAFTVGCGGASLERDARHAMDIRSGLDARESQSVPIEATIIEPFMPKQETASGLALAPEAYLLQRASEPADEARRSGWPNHSAYRMSDDGVVYQTMTDEFKELIDDSFAALREAFDDDAEFLDFLSSVFDPPQGADRYSFEAYFRGVWLQCKRHNPEPTLPGQPLPHKNSIAGRFVEVLAAMNRMMRTA
ncbi:MAG: hypothetical protein LBK46_01615 [Oscillospiraceae bacterium]|jgi:hypothetical protein|nr:hypothetical protein [Oscillospiraceae bacterium]